MKIYCALVSSLYRLFLTLHRLENWEIYLCVWDSISLSKFCRISYFSNPLQADTGSIDKNNNNNSWYMCIYQCRQRFLAVHTHPQCMASCKSQHDHIHIGKERAKTQPNRISRKWRLFIRTAQTPRIHVSATTAATVLVVSSLLISFQCWLFLHTHIYSICSA